MMWIYIPCAESRAFHILGVPPGCKNYMNLRVSYRQVLKMVSNPSQEQGYVFLKGERREQVLTRERCYQTLF